ncbi:MAG: sugar phosphate isomerase/epimerase [Nitrospinae bacterium]|nr:sugar phosphate isomerase/epimerase [Nitrospinota bacterium]
MSRNDVPFLSVPAALLDLHLKDAVDRGLNLEVHAFWRELEDFPAETLAAIDAARGEGMRVSLHAPFIDMAPGADDPLMREATLARFAQAALLARRLGAVSVVVHPGWDRRRYWGDDDGYVTRAAATFSTLMELTEPVGCTVALENIYECEPTLLRRVIDAVGHPRFGHCFDAQHFNLFGRGYGVERWLDVLGDSIVHLHLHNNDGTDDQHQGMRSGTFDYELFFPLLARHRIDPMMTIEPHHIPGVDESLSYLRQLRGAVA